MLDWMARRLGLRTERDIFHFWDGSVTRRADPLALMSRVEDACPEFADLLGIIASDDKGLVMPGPVKDEMVGGQKSATKKILAVIRTAFDVKPLDQTGGLTDAETISLLTKFLVFMGGLAEAARPLPDSPPVESPSPADSPTPSSVVSGTTGT